MFQPAGTPGINEKQSTSSHAVTDDRTFRQCLIVGDPRGLRGRVYAYTHPFLVFSSPQRRARRSAGGFCSGLVGLGGRLKYDQIRSLVKYFDHDGNGRANLFDCIFTCVRTIRK